MGEVARVSQIVCVWRLPSTRSSKVPAPVVTSTTAKYPDIVRLTASIRKVIFNTQRVSPCWINISFDQIWWIYANLRLPKYLLTANKMSWLAHGGGGDVNIFWSSSKSALHNGIIDNKSVQVSRQRVSTPAATLLKALVVLLVRSW